MLTCGFVRSNFAFAIMASWSSGGRLDDALSKHRRDL
jgi:hypothetical protein